MWRADIIFPDGRTQSFDLQIGEVNIGRGPDCELVIDDQSISRSHVKIVVTENSLEVVDLNSVNGVIVNGKRIDGQKTLHPGDKVTLGRVNLTFRIIEGGQMQFPAGPKRKSTPPKPASGEVTLVGSFNLDDIPSDDVVEATRIDDSQLQEMGMDFAHSGGISGEMPECKLFVYLKRKPEVYEVARKQINIGRAADSNVVIEHSSVSRNHARIIPSGSSYILEDLGSGNGTSVNGQQIRRRYLSPGDEVYFGAVPARFSVRDEGLLEMRQVKEPVKATQKSSSGLLKIFIILAIAIFALVFFSDQISQIVKSLTDYVGSVSLNTK